MTNPNILREIGVYQTARLNQKAKLDATINSHIKSPSTKPLQSVFGEAIKSLGIKWWLVDHTVGPDRKKEEKIKAVEGIAVYLNQELNDQISKLGILDGLLSADRTLTEEAERNVERGEPIVMTPATLRSIGRLVIQLAKSVKEKEVPEMPKAKTLFKNEVKRVKTKEKRDVEPEKIKPRKNIVIIVTDGEDRKASSVIVGTREVPMEQVDQAVLLALATATNQTLTVPELYQIIVAHADPTEELQPEPSYLDMSSRVNRTINVIRGNNTIGVKAKKVRNVTVANPSSYSLVDVDCQILSESQAREIEQQRKAKNMQALNDVLDVLDGTSQRSMRDILQAMPPSRAHKQLLNQHAYLTFSTLIGHAANARRSNSELDDSDRALLNRVINYMETHTSIRNLSEFVSAVAVAVGGIRPDANHSKVINSESTLEVLRELRKRRGSIITNINVDRNVGDKSFESDLKLVEANNFAIIDIRKALAKTLEIFPPQRDNSDGNLQAYRYKLQDVLIREHYMPFGLPFIQFLVNKRILRLNVTNSRVTVDTQLNRAEIAYIFFLKMRSIEKRSNLQEMSIKIPEALMRVIEHELPIAAQEIVTSTIHAAK